MLHSFVSDYFWTTRRLLAGGSITRQVILSEALAGCHATTQLVVGVDHGIWIGVKVVLLRVGIVKAVRALRHTHFRSGTRAHLLREIRDLLWAVRAPDGRLRAFDPSSEVCGVWLTWHCGSGFPALEQPFAWWRLQLFELTLEGELLCIAEARECPRQVTVGLHHWKVFNHLLGMGNVLVQCFHFIWSQSPWLLFLPEIIGRHVLFAVNLAHCFRCDLLLLSLPRSLHWSQALPLVGNLGGVVSILDELLSRLLVPSEVRSLSSLLRRGWLSWLLVVAEELVSRLGLLGCINVLRQHCNVECFTLCCERKSFPLFGFTARVGIWEGLCLLRIGLRLRNCTFLFFLEYSSLFLIRKLPEL